MTALDILLTEAQSTELSPFVAPGTVGEIATTKAKASEAVASLAEILVKENAAELVENGLKEAHEAVADIVKKRKMVRVMVDTGKTFAGVEVEEEPPAKKAKGKGNGKGFGFGNRKPKAKAK